MDLHEYERIKREHVSHWAQPLEVGYICKATIQHQTDDSKNRHNVDAVVIVIENHKTKTESYIIGYFDGII